MLTLQLSEKLGRHSKIVLPTFRILSLKLTILNPQQSEKEFRKFQTDTTHSVFRGQ